jgi:hypothetical protein
MHAKALFASGKTKVSECEAARRGLLHSVDTATGVSRSGHATHRPEARGP